MFTYNNEVELYAIKEMHDWNTKKEKWHLINISKDDKRPIPSCNQA